MIGGNTNILQRFSFYSKQHQDSFFLGKGTTIKHLGLKIEISSF